MLFCEPVFLLCFLPAVLFLYFVPLRRFRTAQNVLLFAASLFFYAWGATWFVLVLMASIVVNWLLGLWVGRRMAAGRSTRPPVAAAAVANLALLFVFKYLTFVLTNLRLLGLQLTIPVIELPIGISFFTFQSLSYVIDVSRGKGQPQRSLLNVGLYVAFFPQLIAGPIVKYETVAREILHRRESWEDFSAGVARFVAGLSKKVLLSNQLAAVARAASATPAGLSAAAAWLGGVAYILQLYYDFSGYSDMAIGLGRMFGFHFRENFRHPLAARSLADFWSRWHISLTTWFRDYLYIPLGGSRVKSSARRLLNLSAVWVFSGIWHGANWTYLLWGVINFALVMAERGLHLKDKPPKFIGWLYTFVCFVLTTTIFWQPSITAALHYLGAMFGLNGGGLWSDQAAYLLCENLLVFAVGFLLLFPVAPWLNKKAARWGLAAEAGRALLTLAALTAVTVLLARGSYNPFIYYNF